MIVRLFYAILGPFDVETMIRLLLQTHVYEVYKMIGVDLQIYPWRLRNLTSLTVLLVPVILRSSKAEIVSRPHLRTRAA